MLQTTGNSAHAGCLVERKHPQHLGIIWTQHGLLLGCWLGASKQQNHPNDAGDAGNATSLPRKKQPPMGRSKKTNSGSSKLSIEVLCGSMPGRAPWSSNTAKSQNPSHLAIFQDHVCRFPKDQRRSERTCPHKQDTIILDSLCEPKRHGVHLRSFHGMPFISHSCSKKNIPLEGRLQTKKCERASTMEFKAHGTHSP